MQFPEGTRCLVNRVTGAVFFYNERIAGLADLYEAVADAEGNLVKVGTRSPPDPKLAPTETPEKEDDTPAPAPKAATGKATLAPVDK